MDTHNPRVRSLSPRSTLPDTRRCRASLSSSVCPSLASSIRGTERLHICERSPHVGPRHTQVTAPPLRSIFPLIRYLPRCSRLPSRRRLAFPPIDGNLSRISPALGTVQRSPEHPLPFFKMWVPRYMRSAFPVFQCSVVCRN